MGMYLFALLVTLLGIIFLGIAIYTRTIVGFLIAGTVCVIIGTGIQLFATSGSLVHW